MLQTAFHLDKADNPVQFAYLILITVAVTTVVWLKAVTFVTVAGGTRRDADRVLPTRAAFGRVDGTGSRLLGARGSAGDRATSDGTHCSTGCAGVR